MIESYSQIFQNLKKDVYSYVYLLMGEETFYIDKLSNYIEDNFIDKSLKSFNHEVHYGRDSDIKSIISSCNSFPMMSNKKLVLVKEAQEMDFFKRYNEKSIELFNNYLDKPNTSTLLVICHKNKSLDKRSKLYKSFLEKSTILDSSSKVNKVYDNQIPSWINRQVVENGYKIDEKSTFLIAENVGNNLERIHNSLEKIMLNKEDKSITQDDVIKFVGISRDYNFFEFQDSLIDKDSLKFSKISQYFTSNENKYPFQQLLIYMFSFYSKLLVIKNKNLDNPQSIATELNMHPFVAKSYNRASNKYSVDKIKQILEYLSELDLISKGIKSLKFSYNSTVREMSYKLF
ncbi:MAG: DNA polymerase III subunit delta [Rickettsiales bacterium TMED289]|nr:MAG: DNA polymerase III subunit delta [Rickettsiales bacterium TMED289]|tara:strand:+ start:3039 stop:4073 length:1035 start_codon:yes stop_codon:yes gene_type:complete